MMSTRDGRRWRIGDVELLTADFESPLQELLCYDVVSQAAVQPILASWLGRPEYHSTLLDVCRVIGARHSAGVGEPPDSWIRSQILTSFRSGKLYLLRRRSGSSANRAAEQAAAAVPKKTETPPAPPKEKTWIEIRLVDQNDQPVGNRKYRLKITDGSVREGTLGSDGVIRVNGIDPGTCEICFPDDDANEWHPA